MRTNQANLKRRFERFGVSLKDVAAMTGLTAAIVEDIVMMKTPAPDHLIVFAHLLGQCPKATREQLVQYVSDTEWIQIPGYSRYEASNKGEIRRASHGPGAIVGLPLNKHQNRYGYWSVTVTPDGRKQEKVGVHRLVCMAFHGPPPEGKPFACHRNGKCEDNGPGNLYWGSPKDNSLDHKRHSKERREGFARRSQERYLRRLGCAKHVQTGAENI